jgi:hypothetical protein
MLGIFQILLTKLVHVAALGRDLPDGALPSPNSGDLEQIPASAP